MAESEINWQHEREVYTDKNTGDQYVKVFRGFMEVDDYIEGGRICSLPAGEYDIKTYTNAQLSNGEHEAGKGTN